MWWSNVVVHKASVQGVARFAVARQREVKTDDLGAPLIR